MESQTHMDMAQGEIQEERTKVPAEEITETEKQFLKDLYVFMKKRDTPVERIPNLGFKQIDLFVMFKTVRDLGGYHQVTAQQLWKQVYNTLGGNPRSTSAATCTRRHYEKLLLPYECHVKGILMNIVPQHQPKHYANYSKDDDDGQMPAKRKLLSLPLHQNPHTPHSDRHRGVFPVPLHYPRYYRPSHALMPPHLPIPSSVLTPHSPPVPQPQFSFDPFCLNPERVTEPLEHLRYLAERYKTSSGLAEPLNLSIKASKLETSSNPASSFAPPSSSKNPKFLNKPSPLYSPHCPQVVRSERCETQDDEAGFGDTPYLYPGKAGEAYVVKDKALTASSSPSSSDPAPTLRTDDCATTMAQKPSSPKTDFTMQTKEDREKSPDARVLDFSQILPSLPRENERGEMEIEIPLSVFHNWLRVCRSSAMMHGDKQLPPLPTPEEHSGQRSSFDTDIPPTNLTFRTNPQHWSSVAEDLRLKQSPKQPIQSTGNHCNTSQNPLTGYKPLSSGRILKNVASWDVYPFDQQDINRSYSSKPPSCWDAYDQATPIQAKTDSNPLTVPQNFGASKSYNEEPVEGGKEKSERVPSAVLMLNPNSTSLLHLTTEEVMKLKKIISSSS